jgi:putative transposase
LNAPEGRHRRSIRLPAYDYGSAGAYFVTICARQRQLIFDRQAVVDAIWSVWEAIPKHFSNAAIDEFIVMPNHLHGIVWIVADARVGAQHAAPLRSAVQPGSLGAIVRSFKSAATRSARQMGFCDDRPMWQRNYYERIIRNETELYAVRECIRLNPTKWLFDSDNPDHAESSDYSRDWGWLEDHSSNT